MSLINPSLEHVYCSNLASNHVLIRLIRFVSRFTIHLCNAIYFLTTFSTPCKQFTKKLHFAFWDLNRARSFVLHLLSCKVALHWKLQNIECAETNNSPCTRSRNHHLKPLSESNQMTCRFTIYQEQES